MAGLIQRELALLVTGKDVSATRTLRGVNRELGKLNSIARKAGRNVAANLERAVVAGGAVAIGAIGYAVKAAMDFETATAGVAKTVEGDINAIVEGLRDMSAEAPIAYEELAAIAEAGGALAIAKEDLLDYTDVVAKLGLTTDLTSEAAATALGHLGTTLNLTGDAYEHVGNTLVDLGNKGASTETQILGMAEGVAGVAGIVNLSTPQVLGWGAAWANTGEEVEAGSTELQKLFLETFGMVNAGGADLKLLAKIAGTTSKDFADAYRTDASATMSNFLVQLGKLSEVEQAATLEKLGFTDIRITRGLLKILANTDNLTDSLDTATTAWDENNAMQIEAEKRFATSASQMKILENNVKLAAATVGSELLPVINELAREGVDWIQDHEAEIAAFGKDLAGNIREAVSWAKQLDWDAIGGALGAGAGAAAALVTAFTSAPPWVQQFLAGGFVADKFTGGAVGDLLGVLAQGLVKGVLGMNAGVVNLRAGVVNGAGGGAGGGAPVGGGLGLPGKLFLAATVVEVVATAVDVSGVNDPRHKTADGRTFRGTNVPTEQLANLRAGEARLVERVAAGDTTAARQLEAVRAEIAKLEDRLGIGVTAIVGASAPAISPDERDELRAIREASDRVYDAVEAKRLETHLTVNVSTAVSVRDTAIKTSTIARYGNVAS